MENNNNPETSRSTSVVAKKHNLSRDGLFAYLIANSYLTRSNGRHVLTDKGVKLGGSYRECDDGKWPVWSEGHIDSLIQETKRSVAVVGSFKKIKEMAVGRYQPSNIERDEMHVTLSHGTKILHTQEELDAYLVMFGSMHAEKLNRAYGNLDQCENLTQLAYSKNIQLIDYACGQGLASMLLIEYFNRKKIDHYISKLTLIEPSTCALETCTSKFAGKVVKINKKFDDLLEQDILTAESCVKFHLFSNILDMGQTHFDLKVLAEKIIKSQKGTNYFVCVGVRERRKLDEFMRYFTGHSVISTCSDEIPNPSSHSGSKPSWHVEWNIFKVEL